MLKHPIATRTHVEPIEIAADGSIIVPPGDLDFLNGWKPTTEAAGKDVAESKRICKAINALMSQCWFNARRAIVKLDDYAEASYVEAWASVEYMPIEHGWIVRNGVIIDPTLPGDEMTYFPGLEFCGRAGIASFLNTPKGKKHKRTPFFHAFGWGGMQSPLSNRAMSKQWLCSRKSILGVSHEDYQQPTIVEPAREADDHRN
jgi:hypothetical protein